MNQKQEILVKLKRIDRELYKNFSFNVHKFKSKEKIFSELDITSASYPIAGNQVVFLTIHNIELNKSHRGQGILTDMLNILDDNKVPVMIDNIENYQLFGFLTKKGYKNLKHLSVAGWTRCMYKDY